MKKSLILIGVFGILVLSGCGDKKEATSSTDIKDEVACKKAYSDLQIDLEAKAKPIEEKFKNSPNAQKEKEAILDLLTDHFKQKADIDRSCARVLAQSRIDSISNNTLSKFFNGSKPLTRGTPKDVDFK